MQEAVTGVVIAPC